MNRRELLGKFGALLAVNEVAAEVAEVKEEPKPLFFTITTPKAISRKMRDAICECRNAIWKGDPPAPLVVLDQGLQLTPIYREPAPADLDGRSKAYRDAIERGALTVNDARRLEGLDDARQTS